ALLAVVASVQRSRAEAGARKAREDAAALALEQGIEACEQGRTRWGLLNIAAGLKMCPPEAVPLRRVMLTNLAAWSPRLLCLDAARRFPGPAVVSSAHGRAVLVKLHDTTVRLFDLVSGEPIGAPLPAAAGKNL